MDTAETILNALYEPVLVLDDTLRAVVANASFYASLMIPPGHVKGKAIQALIVEDRDTHHLRALLESLIAHECDEVFVDVECTVAPGIRKVFSLTARRIRFSDNLHESILVELNDVTWREEAERKIMELNTALQTHASELEHTNRDLESFTFSVSHDLRSPLRLTNKIAHLLIHENKPQLSVGASQKVQMILDSTQEMGILVEDLLAFSQVKHGPVKKRPVGMRRLAHEALEELQDDQKGRDVSVNISDLPSCRADRSLLKQVYLNLLANALKFTRMREKTEIQVGANNSGDQTIYFVRDNGVGFDEKYANTIFLPFHRLHRDEGFEGSGVGLALVERIVECHGGRVWPESRVGHGTTIYFTLDEQSAAMLPVKDRT